MSEKLSTKEFILRGGFIFIGVILILFAAKMWIIDPLTSVKKQAIQPQPAAHSGNFKPKENIKIDWKDAASHIGQYVITEGVIVSAYDSGKVCFLNFHKNFKEHLSLVIFTGDYAKFPSKPDKYYTGKKVRVEGRVKVYQERTEIIVRSPDQIKILDN